MSAEQTIRSGNATYERCKMTRLTKRLAKLERLLAATTPAEKWEYRRLKWRGGYGTKSKVLSIAPWWADGMTPGDAEFIAAVRSELPKLIADVRAALGVPLRAGEESNG